MIPQNAAAEALDLLVPWGHAASVVVTAIAVPAFMWLVGVRFQWRKDRREEQQTVAALMTSLVEMQRSELGRLVLESEGMRRQIGLMTDGRFRLQQALDTLKEQMIAARVLIHDYERRLGLPETAFPPLAIPTLTDPQPLQPSLSAL